MVTTVPPTAPPAGVRALPLTAAGFGVIGLIALALPAVSLHAASMFGSFERTGGFFSDAAQHTGPGIITVMIAAILVGLIGFGAKSGGARAACGTIIMVCGVIGVIIASIVITEAPDYSSSGTGYYAIIEAASGTYLLLSTSIAMALVGLFTLLKRNAHIAVEFEVSL